MMAVLKRIVWAACLSLFCLNFANATAPANFNQAKILLKQHVYFDQNKNGALGSTYCGCDWRWVGRSGGRIDHESCGYKVRAQQTRADRTEWEHIFAAHHFGQQRQCWQNGGRKNCNATDPTFNKMEADMHGLTVVSGEVNADRSNYRMGVVSSAHDGMYGACRSKTDFKNRVFEPRNEAKGMVARVHFYFADRYRLRLSVAQQKLFILWDEKHPVSDWEALRDKRIARIMGHHNEFVTGERTWTLGHKSSGDGVARSSGVRDAARVPPVAANDSSFIRGNRNSKIYHLPACPSYDAMNPRNRVEFSDESKAIESGYRKARNCP